MQKEPSPYVPGLLHGAFCTVLHVTLKGKERREDEGYPGGQP